MPNTQNWSDQQLINVLHQWRRMAGQGSGKATEQARKHEAELRRRFGRIGCTMWSSRSADVETTVRVNNEPVTITEATRIFMISTADSTTQSVEAVQELLHSLRVVLEMDIAFVAEFVNTKRIYRCIDQDNEPSACAKVSDSAPLEITLCQRVVEGRLPPHLCDAQSHPEIVNVRTTNASGIMAYLSAPEQGVSRDQET